MKKRPGMAHLKKVYKERQANEEHSTGALN